MAATPALRDGASEGSLDEALAYASARKVFGGTPASARRRDGTTLFVKPGTNPEIALLARSETRFQDPRGPFFEFQLDGQGKVTGAILEQGTQRIPLEQAVGLLLAERGLTVGTAESCTGGMLGERITSIPG